MTPAEAFEQIDSRLWDVLGQGVNPWIAGARLIGDRLGLDPVLALDGVLTIGGAFARVVEAEDPRRFTVATEAQRAAASPALILQYQGDDGVQGDDLIALSLKPASRRYWRMDCACDWLGPLWPDAHGVLKLRQDAHAYVAGVLKAAGYRHRGREARRVAAEAGWAAARRRSGLANMAEAMTRPVDDAARRAYVAGAQATLRAARAAEAQWTVLAREPDGALILDPVAIDWSRRGALAEAESVEILDAPADGPLGRALQRLNPRLGTSRGPALWGLEPVAGNRKGRRAA